jgi:hypothetical protein
MASFARKPDCSSAKHCTGLRYCGAWGILYSCTIILLVCVNNALHLNVPAYDEGLFSNFWRGVKWVLIAIIAPEVALLSAFSSSIRHGNYVASSENWKIKTIANPKQNEQSAHAIPRSSPSAGALVNIKAVQLFARFLVRDSLCDMDFMREWGVSQWTLKASPNSTDTPTTLE